MRHLATITVTVVVLACAIVFLVRQQGFLPWPAAPITIDILDSTTTLGKGDYPGSADAPPASSTFATHSLEGFDTGNTYEDKCIEDSVIPAANNENMRSLKCRHTQTDVPFFGPGAPATNDTIWLLHWLSVDRTNPTADSRPLAHSAYASYGACWLALQRLAKADYDTFSENVDRATRAHSPLPTWNPAPSYCKALKNSPKR